MANDVKYPFGNASTASLTATGAQAITITDQMTFIDGVTTQATGNRTINLTIKEGVKAGATIHLRNKTNGTETTTFGTGMTAPTLTGVAGKTFVQKFIYNGTSFFPTGASLQID